MTCEQRNKGRKTIKRKPYKSSPSPSPQKIILEKIKQKQKARKNEKLAIECLYRIMKKIDRLNFEKDMFKEEYSKKLNTILKKQKYLDELQKLFESGDYEDEEEADKIEDDIIEINRQIKSLLRDTDEIVEDMDNVDLQLKVQSDELAKIADIFYV